MKIFGSYYKCTIYLLRSYSLCSNKITKALRVSERSKSAPVEALQGVVVACRGNRCLLATAQERIVGMWLKSRPYWRNKQAKAATKKNYKPAVPIT